MKKKKRARPTLPATRRNLALELKIARAENDGLKKQVANLTEAFLKQAAELDTIATAFDEICAELDAARGRAASGITLPGPDAGPPLDLLRA